MITRDFITHEVNAEAQQLAEPDGFSAELRRSQIPRLLDVAEVARALGLPKASIYRILATKLLKAIKIGRRLKVSEDDLLAFIQKGGAGLD